MYLIYDFLKIILFSGWQDKSFCCGECGRLYKHKKSLLLHQRYECGKEPQFACQFCPYKAKQRGDLRKHSKIRHSVFLPRLNATNITL